MTRWMFTPATLALALAACTETSIDATKAPAAVAEPDILVTPGSLTFGTLGLGETETQSLTIENVGEATLQVRNVVIGSGASFAVTAAEALAGRLVAFPLEPGEQRDVDITFSPSSAAENVGEASVFSDDPDTVEWRVPLSGAGTPPELRITPSTYAFDDRLVPCSDLVELTLENVGTDVLEITSYDYQSGGLLSLYDATLPPLPIVLGPGDTVRATVHFDAETKGPDDGVLSVTSNDPRGVVTAEQTGQAVYAAERTESFTEPGVPPVDVLVLIDQSGSMAADNSPDVLAGFPDFVTQLQSVSDWQLALITDYSDPDAGCATGGVLDAQSYDVANFLVNNAFPGIQPSLTYDTEALLRLADTALSKAVPGGCNDGFLRPGALLHVVVMSDEAEQSGAPGATWVTRYQSFVTSPDLVRVSGVLDLLGRCGDGTGPGGYLDAVTLTGGTALDICSAGWGLQFSDIAAAAVAGIRTYNLSEEPDPRSVEVTVNGNPTADFTVYANNVTIDSPPVGAGDLVEIGYGVLAQCE